MLITLSRIGYKGLLIVRAFFTVVLNRSASLIELLLFGLKWGELKIGDGH